MKKIAVRPQALIELEESAHYYESEQVGLGDRFSDSVETAFEKLREMPGIGSKRYVDLVSGLHMYVLSTFPFLIFYFDKIDHIEVVRLIHAKRDLPHELRE